MSISELERIRAAIIDNPKGTLASQGDHLLDAFLKKACITLNRDARTRLIAMDAFGAHAGFEGKNTVAGFLQQCIDKRKKNPDGPIHVAYNLEF